MSMTTTAARYRVRPARANEVEDVGRLTFEGFGHRQPAPVRVTTCPPGHRR
ncbi:MAG: hypothetical protein WAL27_14520 [Cellulosimicrobium cellulans]